MQFYFFIFNKTVLCWKAVFFYGCSNQQPKENIASPTKPFNNYLVYLWTALYLEDELADFKKSILKIADKYQIRCPLTIVPVHLSLKISFDIKDKMTDKCIQEICRYFYGQAPFLFVHSCQVLIFKDLLRI